MKLRKLLLVTLWMALPVLPALAQIDRVVLEVVEIDCLPCAATIQYEVKKIDGVDKVAISMEKQLVAVTYKPDAHFDAKAIREAIKKAEVRVEAFHLAIRGKLEQEDGKKVFISNGDHFAVTDGPEGMPMDTAMGIMASVDDTTTPYGLTIDDFKVTTGDASTPAAAPPAETAAPPATAPAESNSPETSAKPPASESAS